MVKNMDRVIFSFLVAFVLFFIALLNINSAEACAFCGKYKVIDVAKGDVLNLRSGPNTKSQVIGSLPYNGVNIEMAGKCEENGWCTIKFFGVEAWLNTKYLVRMDTQKE